MGWFGGGDGSKPSNNGCPPHNFETVRSQRGVENGKPIVYEHQKCTKCSKRNLEIIRSR